MELTALLEQVEVEKAEKKTSGEEYVRSGQYPSKEIPPGSTIQTGKGRMSACFLLKQMVCMV